MIESLETSLRRTFAGTSSGQLVAVTVPAPPGLWSDVLARSGTTLDEEPRTFWASGRKDEGIWVGRGAVRILRGRGEQRLSNLQNLVEELFLSIDNRTTISDRLRVFGGAAFLPDETQSGPTRAFGNASFILPRLSYVDAGSESSWTIVSDGEDLDALVGFLAPLLAGGAPRSAERIRSATSPIASRIDRAAADSFRGLVRLIQHGIGEGRFDKVVLARRLRVLLGREPELEAVLTRLMEGGPDSVRFAYAMNGGTFLGATPERLVSIRGRELEADALAGTIPRTAQDAKERLLGSAKDLSEHEFVVQAIRAALAPLAEDLLIGDSPEITELPQMFHLRTPIRARLRERHHPLDLVARLHPTPAVGGSPRDAALRFIAEQEVDPRGWYAGPFGWLDPQGDGEFVVALRSAFLEGKTADLFAGAGIVEGSDPDAEWEETELKLGRMLGALGIARELRSHEPELARSVSAERSAAAPPRQP